MVLCSFRSGEVDSFLGELNFCLGPGDSVLSGPSLTKDLNTAANKMVKNLLILNSPGRHFSLRLCLYLGLSLSLGLNCSRSLSLGLSLSLGCSSSLSLCLSCSSSLSLSLSLSLGFGFDLDLITLM